MPLYDQGDTDQSAALAAGNQLPHLLSFLEQFSTKMEIFDPLDREIAGSADSGNQAIKHW